MIPTKIRVALMVLALVACRDKRPEMANVAEVLPNLPLPPQASLVARHGSAEAVKITLRSNAKPDQVADYYRNVLSKNGWRLVNDSRDREGAVVLLAEQDGPPLWVRIQGTADSAATMIELAGARQTPARPAKPAS